MHCRCVSELWSVHQEFAFNTLVRIGHWTLNTVILSINPPCKPFLVTLVYHLSLTAGKNFIWSPQLLFLLTWWLNMIPTRYSENSQFTHLVITCSQNRPVSFGLHPLYWLTHSCTSYPIMHTCKIQSFIHIHIDGPRTTKVGCWTFSCIVLYYIVRPWLWAARYGVEILMYGALDCKMHLNIGYLTSEILSGTSMFRVFGKLGNDVYTTGAAFRSSVHHNPSCDGVCTWCSSCFLFDHFSIINRNVFKMTEKIKSCIQNALIYRLMNTVPA